MSKDTGAARLPGLPVLRTTDQALAKWAQAVAEHLEVRAGTRGNPLERAVTVRDLTNATREITTGFKSSANIAAGDIPIDLGGGRYASLSISKFSESLRSTKLYKDLVTSVNDPNRFNDVPEAVRNILLKSIADEAALRGASVSHIENLLQTATDSLAMRIDEVTASVEGAAAGIREVAFASASMGSSSAGKITQVQARLDDFSDGTPGVATIEAKMTATASRVDGLASEFYVKASAGSTVTGFGLSASEDPTGATESAFIIQADKFALVASINFSQEATPSATVIGQTWYTPSTKVYKRATATGTANWVSFTPTEPFGVDIATGTTYINGTLRINAGGGLLQDSTAVVDGVDGARGSMTLYTTGSSWVDATANSLITSTTGSATKIIGDTVTISDGTSFAATKYWSGSAWVDPGVVIDGNLLVSGTLSATKISAGALTGFTFKTGTGGTPSGYAFEVTSSGVVWADNLFSLCVFGNSAPGTATTPGVSGTTDNAGEGVFGRVAATNSRTTAHGVRGACYYTGSGRVTTSGIVGSSANFDMYADGNGANYGPFTGAHDALVPKGSTLTKGDILVDMGVACRRNTSNTICFVGLSSSPNQKGVVGVMATDARNMTEDSAPAALKLDMVLVKDGYGDDVLEHKAAPEFSGIAATHACLAMNSLGEGQVNVCGENGDLVIGDLIVSSSMQGKGMRQSDDIIRNTTVAKCRENVTFFSPTEVKMVACIYLCG